MDFEVLPVDHDAFYEESEDRLLGVEVGVKELGPECGDHFLGTEGSTADELQCQVLGLHLGECELGCGVGCFQSLDPSAEGLQGEGPDLVGIRESVPLPGQFLESGFGPADACVLVEGRRGLQLDPRC